MNSNNKRALKENLAMIIRGYKIIFKLLPRYIAWNIAYHIIQIFNPYFSLYMSALVVNELAYSRDIKKLMLLAGITMLGLFLSSVVKRLIQGRANVHGYGLWQADSLFLLKTQNRMQYDHLENPDVNLLHSKIFAATNANGGGLLLLIWNIFSLIGAISEIILSLSLTVSMFKLATTVEYTGFFGFINSPASVLVVLTLIILNAWISITLTNTSSRKVREAWQELAQSNSRHNALRIWGNDVHIFNMKKIILREHAKYNLRPSYIFKAQKYQIKYGTINTIWNYIMTAALFIFVAAKAYIGVFGIGNFILYRGTVERFIRAVSKIGSIIGELINNNEPLSKVFEFLDLPDDMYHGTLSVEKRDDNDYEIEFCDVSFKYPRSDVWALRHVSMKFKIGDTLAIVGMNGSGKTTFIKLLCRLYDVDSGEILLDGVNIKDYDYEDYMKIFAVVFQDFRLLAFSARENIILDSEADEAEIIKLVQMSGLEDKIHELPNGLDTMIFKQFDETGIEPSGGEQQKLAIARALYKNAPVVILDEPTAALDPVAEYEIYRQFNSLVGSKTAVYISHRLSSCKFCDRIAVFSEGTIKELGTHDELIALDGGIYAEMFAAQAQYYQ